MFTESSVGRNSQIWLEEMFLTMDGQDWLDFQFIEQVEMALSVNYKPRLIK